MLERLLFVSKARFPVARAEDEVARLAAAADAANARREITGGLIFTGRYFAVLIEGAPDVISATIAKIEADARHEQLTILARGPTAERQFKDMHMAYAGVASFLDRQIEPFFTGEFAQLSKKETLAWLEALVQRFTALRDTTQKRND